MGLQITGADPGWVAKFILDDGSLVRMRVAFWVCKRDGKFDSVAPGIAGELDFDRASANFAGYEWIGDEPELRVRVEGEEAP